MDASEKTPELLKYAAQLHEIGAAITLEKHHVLSYMIIRNSYLAGFDADELEKIALIVRFHRRALPRITNRMFSGMERKEVSILLKCATILHMADIMDRGRNDAIESIDLEVLNDNLNMTLSTRSDVRLAVWKLGNRGEDFRNLFGLTLAVSSYTV